MGTLIQNSQRQPSSSPATAMIEPPMTGPSAEAVATVTPNMPNARPRSAPRNRSWIRPVFWGVSRPAEAPWSSRARITVSTFGASPTSTLEAMKPSSPSVISRRRP